MAINIPPVPDLLITRHLEELLAKEKPGIVHANGWILFSMLPLKRKFFFPLVVTLHDYRFICPKQTLLRYGNVCTQPFTRNCLICSIDIYGPLRSLFVYPNIKFNRVKLSLVDKSIAVSSFVKQVYSKCLGLDSNEVVRIPNFCNVADFCRTKDNFSSFPDS